MVFRDIFKIQFIITFIVVIFGLAIILYAQFNNNNEQAKQENLNKDNITKGVI